MSRLSLIVAAAANGVIGRDNKLPWHLPNDLKYFKAVTMGKPVVMGRKTFESIGKPLPGRPNIVVTRDPAWTAPGVTVAHGLDEAIRAAEGFGAEEVMIIGGAQIFAESFGKADRLYLTEVHAAVEGDVVLTGYDPADWREVGRERHDGDPAYSFVVLERR